MKRIRISILLLAMALTTGCASTAYTKGKQSALNVAPPAAGKTKVVFARFSQFVGGGIQFHVHDEDRLIGVMPEKSFFVYECDPGLHVFSSSMEDMALLEADLLPDRIYYAKVSAAMGVWIAQVNMYSLHPGCAGNLWPDLPKLLGGLQETVVLPEEVVLDQKGAAKYRERLKVYRAKPQTERILPEHGQTQPIVAK